MQQLQSEVRHYLLSDRSLSEDEWIAPRTIIEQKRVPDESQPQHIPIVRQIQTLRALLRISKSARRPSRSADREAFTVRVGEAALDHYVISERPLTEDELALQSAVINLEA